MSSKLAGSTASWKRWHTLFLLGFVVIISYLTYFHRYTSPQAPFWDENYYITDAQREMNGMFYMQIHPPLGKLLIAWGEQLTHANADTTQFVSTEHANEFPKNFSFVGYRLFPVLLSWLAAPLLFLIFLFITKNPLMSTFLSFLYVYDNALIVHNRGAMLDGPMLFFVILVILAFFLVLRTRGRTKAFIASSLLFGAAIALGLATKFQNAIMFVLVPFLLWKLRPAKGPSSKADAVSLLQFLWASALGFLVCFVGVWQIHFANMITINPQLNNNGYYQASDQYKAILASGRQGSLFSFPVMLRDSLAYVGEYNKGIPKLDLCKPDENGSPWFLWPVGATAINYRWETPDGEKFHYLYLVSNPVVWFAGLIAVILAVAYLLAPIFHPLLATPSSAVRSAESIEGRFLIAAFTALYVCYMITMAAMDRVLFLYSYFPPLIFSFILVALVTMELRSVWKLQLTEEHRVIGLGILAALIFVSHQFFRPLTYYEPLTDDQMKRRAILPLWQLHCVNCDNIGPLVKHRCEQ